MWTMLSKHFTRSETECPRRIFTQNSVSLNSVAFKFMTQIITFRHRKFSKYSRFDTFFRRPAACGTFGVHTLIHLKLIKKVHTILIMNHRMINENCIYWRSKKYCIGRNNNFYVLGNLIYKIKISFVRLFIVQVVS